MWHEKVFDVQYCREKPMVYLKRITKEDLPMIFVCTDVLPIDENFVETGNKTKKKENMCKPSPLTLYFPRYIRESHEYCT